MSITLDTSGETMTLRTRSGIDLIFVIDVYSEDGTPMDLTGHLVLARIFVDDTPTELDTEIQGSSIVVPILSTLTEVLPPQCKFSISLVNPNDVVTGLFYGPIYINEVYPA